MSNTDYGGTKQKKSDSFFTKWLDTHSDFFEYVYQQKFSECVSLRECVRYYRKEAEKLKTVSTGGFIISVKKNPEPLNENDTYIVIQGLLDKEEKPIVVKGETVSRIIHCKTIDDALIRALNSQESVIVKL